MTALQTLAWHNATYDWDAHDVNDLAPPIEWKGEGLARWARILSVG